MGKLIKKGINHLTGAFSRALIINTNIGNNVT